MTVFSLALNLLTRLEWEKDGSGAVDGRLLGLEEDTEKFLLLSAVEAEDIKPLAPDEEFSGFCLAPREEVIGAGISETDGIGRLLMFNP